MRTIGVVTTSRADYGIYLPLLRAICAQEDLRLYLIVSGMHLSPEFGLTVKMIEADGFEIGDRIEMLLSSDSPEGIGKSLGLGVIGFAQSLARRRPDLLVVLGDRFEMSAAAIAALPCKIPVAHLHGGETTEGAIDESLRHAITKLSHLHFVSTEDYARRVVQLGEEPWRVTVCGALSLDNLKSMPLLSPGELSAKFGLRLDEPPLLVTFHPVTLEYEQAEQQTRELLAALEACGLPVVFTAPNADTHGRIVRRLIDEFVRTHERAQLVETMGTQGFFSLMSFAAAMVGNSSSGIIEAASFKLPVVNAGTRQQGRMHGDNVVDARCNREDVAAAIAAATDTDFRRRLSGSVNPYDRGGASRLIIERLQQVPLDEQLIRKQFHDLNR